MINSTMLTSFSTFGGPSCWQYGHLNSGIIPLFVDCGTAVWTRKNQTPCACRAATDIWQLMVFVHVLVFTETISRLNSCQARSQQSASPRTVFN